MTGHVHDQAGSRPSQPGSGTARRARPRWLLPGVVAAAVAAGLVLAGIVPLSTVLYGGLFGGMILMHLVGHGGHGGHGGSQGQAGEGSPEAERQPDATDGPPREAAERAGAGVTEPSRSDEGETPGDKQRTSHGGH